MAYIFCLLNGRHGIEDVLLENTVPCEGVNGEVANAERGQVLEEVRTLRRVYVVVLQA